MSRLLQPADVAGRQPEPLDVDVLPAAEQNPEAEYQLLAWLLSLRTRAATQQQEAA